MPKDIHKTKQELITAARRAYTIGLQTGNGGNLSCRIKGTDAVIIKPSGSSFAEHNAELVEETAQIAWLLANRKQQGD